MLIATSTGTFMHIIHNNSYDNDTLVSITREIYEMAKGAVLSRKMVFGAHKALQGARNTATRGKKMRGFINIYERIIHYLFDAFFFK